MAQAAAQQQGNGSGQGSWMPQGGPSPSFDHNGNAQTVRAQLQNQQQQGQNHILPSPSHPHAQIQQENHLLNQVVPPRSGQTPHQLQHLGPNSGGTGGGAAFSNQMSPNMAPQFQFPTNSGGANASSPLSGGTLNSQSASTLHPSLLPPLDKTRFESAYRNFSANKGLKLEAGLMNVDGKTIDLHALHTCVMEEGGFQKV